MKMLKITRKRTIFQYFNIIEICSMRQGYEFVKTDSLRWKRLQRIISSVEVHLVDAFGSYGVYV